MRRKVFLSFWATMLYTLVAAQMPQAFSYQAAIRNESNQPLANQTVTVRLSIIDDLNTANVVYSEQHSATTNAQGIISLAVGMGNPISGNFSAIPWGQTAIFIKTEVDIANNGTFVTMGTTQILAVPYALASGDGLNSEPGSAGQTMVHSGTRWQANSQILALTSGVVISASPGKDKNQAIFAVRNTLGDTILAVYETGVKIMIDDDPSKSTKGGFAVGGLSSKGKSAVDYLRVTPDSSFITFNNDTRSTKGGFAIGGLSSGKEGFQNYFTLRPELIEFSFDETLLKRSTKGGFAIGGLSSGKTNPNSYLSLRPELVRFTFDESAMRSTKGGFAIGGLSSGKDTTNDYFTIDPKGTTITIPNYGDSTGSFLVGQWDNGEFTPIFSATPDTLIVAATMVSQGDMIVQGNINLGGNMGSIVTDADGNQYQTVKIGYLEWFTSNLLTTKYSDGTPIKDSEGNPLYFQPRDTLDNTLSISTYGYLYRYTAIYNPDSKNVCPEGWWVAEYYDIFNLTDIPSGQLLNPAVNWPTYDSQQQGPITNSSGFSAVNAGYYDSQSGQYIDGSVKGYYWIRDNDGTPLRFLLPDKVQESGNTIEAYSVRCVRYAD